MSEPKTIRVLGCGGDYEDHSNPNYKPPAAAQEPPWVEAAIRVGFASLNKGRENIIREACEAHVIALAQERDRLAEALQKIPCSCGLAQKDYSKGGIIPAHSSTCASSIARTALAAKDTGPLRAERDTLRTAAIAALACIDHNGWCPPKDNCECGVCRLRQALNTQSATARS